MYELSIFFLFPPSLNSQNFDVFMCAIQELDLILVDMLTHQEELFGKKNTLFLSVGLNAVSCLYTLVGFKGGEIWFPCISSTLESVSFSSFSNVGLGKSPGV